MPLGRDSSGLCPVLDGALAPAEQVTQGTLAAETADDALGGVERGFHVGDRLTKKPLDV